MAGFHNYYQILAAMISAGILGESAGISCVIASITVRFLGPKDLPI